MTSLKLALNTTEAATATGLSVDTIKKAIRSGALRAKRSSTNEDGDPTGRYVIFPEQLKEWLDGMEDA